MEVWRNRHRIGAYLVHQDDGTLGLRLDNPNAVGVSQPFLDDYQTGLAEINELIKRGWVVADDNFDLLPGPQLPANPSEIDAGLAEIEEQVTGEKSDEALPAGETPAYHYGRGFTFSFHSGRHVIPYRYASFGPTFASRFRYGRYGARFSLLFGFNRGFFNRTFRYGGYGYVPYYSSYRYGYNRFYYYPSGATLVGAPVAGHRLEVGDVHPAVVAGHVPAQAAALALEEAGSGHALLPGGGEWAAALLGHHHGAIGGSGGKPRPGC